MDATLKIPIFPLGSVLFPAGRLALRIFETRYYEMTKACIRDNAVFGVSLIRAGFEVGKPAIPCDVGCTARIAEWEVPAAGLFSLSTRGECVYRILERWTQPDGLIMAEVRLAEPPDPVSLPNEFLPLKSLLEEIIEKIGPDHFPAPQRMEDAAWVGNRIAELLPVPPERKQQLLEMQDPLAMLAAIEHIVQDLRNAS